MQALTLLAGNKEISWKLILLIIRVTEDKKKEGEKQNGQRLHQPPCRTMTMHMRTIYYHGNVLAVNTCFAPFGPHCPGDMVLRIPTVMVTPWAL